MPIPFTVSVLAAAAALAQSTAPILLVVLVVLVVGMPPGRIKHSLPRQRSRLALAVLPFNSARAPAMLVLQRPLVRLRQFQRVEEEVVV